MTVTRIDPFAEFARLLADADGWVPPVDIYETEGHDLVLKAELPDMNREDIELTVERNTLTLKGTRKRPAGSARNVSSSGFAPSSVVSANTPTSRSATSLKSDSAAIASTMPG